MAGYRLNNFPEPPASGCSYQSTGDATALTLQSTWYAWAGTFAAGNLEGFTESGGVLTYTGPTRSFHAAFSGGLRTSINGTLDVGFSINGDDPLVCAIYSGRITATSSGHATDVQMTLNPGDNVRMMARHPTSAGALFYFEASSRLNLLGL